jgi:hypothetical protein
MIMYVAIIITSTVDARDPLAAIRSRSTFNFVRILRSCARVTPVMAAVSRLDKCRYFPTLVKLILVIYVILGEYPLLREHPCPYQTKVSWS